MKHLLALSVGPVQEFIAAARRTRDLWFGSHLLSEISRDAANAIERHGGELIFPARADAENVANVILVELTAGDPKEVVATAKKAARDCWREFAVKAKGEVSQIIRGDTWADQLDDVIEFYAAWVLRSDDYKRDRARVMRLLGGRKSCRDFRQPGVNDAGLPKSSLDGQRPTVLVGPKPGEPRETYRENWPKKLRLSPGEQLDVVGITKRLGKKLGESDPRYPSVARVAGETWLQGVKNQTGFAELLAACANVKGLNKVAEPSYGYFPYEGTVIYRDRHPDLIAELGEEVREPLKQVARVLKHLGAEPNPYLAVLVADGDKIGDAISRLELPTAHQEFSQALAGFAGQARKVVGDHNGVLVYAGGDDVLAFVPVAKCLVCARELHDEFAKQLAAYGPPTLSVGIAIGHFLENLEDLREYGHAAEKKAKSVEGKDALAVHLHKRGGAPIEVRGRWGQLDERVDDFAQQFLKGEIPSRLAYDLKQLAKVYDNWPRDTEREQADLADAICKDMMRVIRAKRPKSDSGYLDKLKPKIEMRVKHAADLVSFAEELLVARQIAVALKQAGEKPR